MRFKLVASLFSLIMLLFFFTGCSTTAYYFHGAKGQIDILLKRQPISDLLKQESLDQDVRAKLLLIEDVRKFSERELLLPVGDAYSTYSDLERPYVIWNVYAAPELSLESHTWCYPIAGCFAYRGFFKKSWAEKEAQKLADKGQDVRVAGIVAYSTVGWFEDPVLNTFLLQSEVYLVDLIIHEIAHRKIYIKNDTMFNENFATAVAAIGAEQWYEDRNQSETYEQYQQEKVREKAIVSMLLTYKKDMAAVFKGSLIPDEQKRLRKSEIYDAMHQKYREMKTENGWDDGYDNWIFSLNNATLATLSNYNELVPNFLAMFKQLDENWEMFYQEVERISKLDKDQRYKALKEYEHTPELSFLFDEGNTF